MLLHILNRSPATSLIYLDTLRAMGSEDRLLLIEDAVIGALPSLIDRFDQLQPGRLFVLREDLASRGLASRCSGQAALVDMSGFVELTEQAERTVSWF
ncbi:MAG: sulfurtransferase complex subunit TusB [Halomonas sp.]|nr:sulfurtransferase complex subunit TusB [Halomonas sp.]